MTVLPRKSFLVLAMEPHDSVQVGAIYLAQKTTPHLLTGRVEAIGPEVHDIRVGDRVMVPAQACYGQIGGRDGDVLERIIVEEDQVECVVDDDVVVAKSETM